MTGWPSVTVVVPTSGRPAELRRALVSVLGQDYAGHVTCVVVFDGAEPFDLSDVEPSTPERSLVVTRNTGAQGKAGARNTGVGVSFGGLIAFCDEDVEWLPGKLSAQVEALHAATGASVVVSGIEAWSSGVRTLHVPVQISITGADLRRTASGNLGASTLLVDRDAFEGVIGGFDDECPDAYCAEYEWVLRASRHSPLIVVRDPLVRVYTDEASDEFGRTRITAQGLEYLLAVPDIRLDRRNISRMESAVAFDYAVRGRSPDARRWALRSILHGPGELPAYRALMISVGMVGRGTIDRWASRARRRI